MSIRNTCLFASLVLATGITAGCAANPPRTDSAMPTPASTTQPAVRPASVYVTGSRLPVHASSTGQASGAQPVQSVGQQDITLSGQTNTSDALKNLVPSQVFSSGGLNSGH
jgi:hypothetical protein